MANWGLLQGIGQGLEFAGQQQALSQEEQAKEARLQAYQAAATADARQYQEGQTQKQWAREDERRASDVSTTQKAVKDGRDVAIGLNAAGQPVSEIDLGQAKADYGSIKSNKAGFFDVATKTWYPNPAGSGGDNKPIITQDADGNPIAVNWDGGSIKAIPLAPEGNSAAPTKSELARAKALQQQIDSINKQGEMAELSPELTQMREDAQREIKNIFFKPDGSIGRPYVVPDADAASKLPAGSHFTFEGDNAVKQVPPPDKRPVVVTPTVAPTVDPRIKNPDGSTGYRASIPMKAADGTVVFVPNTDDKGNPLTDAQAIERFKNTGEHLGIFKNNDDASKYAQMLYGGTAPKVATGNNDNTAQPVNGLLKKPAVPTTPAIPSGGPDAKPASAAAPVSEERQALNDQKAKLDAEEQAAAKDKKDKAAQAAKDAKIRQTRKDIDYSLSGASRAVSSMSASTINGAKVSGMTPARFKVAWGEQLVKIIENPDATPEQISAAKALFKSTQ